MKEDYYKTLTRRVVTNAYSHGAKTESLADSEFVGFIGMLGASEVLKNQKIGNLGTARLLTDQVLSKTDRVVDTNGYFSEAGTVFEVSWVYVNPNERYYDLKII